MQTTIAAPVSFRGTPAARFWEFEDARAEYGLISTGPTDLSQLLMAEYTSSYGNDWFVVPVELPVGSLTQVDSLVVTDTFGVQMSLRPLGDRSLPDPHWSMYQLAYLQSSDDSLRGIVRNLFVLPPALGRSLQSPPVEDVLLMRDELANVAWAIERTIESPLEQPLNRGDPALPSSATAAPTPDMSGAPVSSLPLYRLASTVPLNWIPLLPVQIEAEQNTVSVRLRRGTLLRPDGSRQPNFAAGALLNAADPLLVHNEEVPREGVRLTRHYQMARWSDGSTFTWLANRKQVGRGEGSSGLRFDTVEGPSN